MGGPSLGALFWLEKRLFLVDFDCFLNRGEGLLPGDIGFGGKGDCFWSILIVFCGGGRASPPCKAFNGPLLLCSYHPLLRSWGECPWLLGIRLLPADDPPGRRPFEGELECVYVVALQFQILHVIILPPALIERHVIDWFIKASSPRIPFPAYRDLYDNSS